MFSWLYTTHTVVCNNRSVDSFCTPSSLTRHMTQFLYIHTYVHSGCNLTTLERVNIMVIQNAKCHSYCSSIKERIYLIGVCNHRSCLPWTWEQNSIPLDCLLRSRSWKNGCLAVILRPLHTHIHTYKRTISSLTWCRPVVNWAN